MSSPKRAGLALFNIDDNGNIFFRCMIPSDADYGGTRPQLPKGQIDAGDTSRYTAVKEAVEEVGLKSDNLKYVKHFKHYAELSLDVFVGEVYDIDGFVEPGWESMWSGWVDYDTSKNMLRGIQRHIFDEIVAHLRRQV